MDLTQKQIRQFQKMIFTWWEQNKRDLPWRRTHDPYRILISEVMLQQTQVSRVLPVYEAFLTRFPTITALSEASAGEILRMWKGMGYNRRALYLQKSAQVIITSHNGIFPDNETSLRALPGIGLYTARAILVFAFKKDVAMVDTNIRKIITHVFFGDVVQKPATIQTFADKLMPIGKSWQWHQALMDYATIALSNVQMPRTPGKKQVPFRQSDRFYRGKIIDLLREKEVSLSQLLAQLKGTYYKPEAFFTGILQTLQKEGLITRGTDDVLSLPS